MKHYNPFDSYENNENIVDENTVLEETGVSYENIKNRVFENINKSKRKRRKKGPVLALVAIIATIASVTTVAGVATGKFNEVFGNIFSGEVEEDLLYTGDDVKINCSDDTLNVELLGMTAGNKSEVYIAYQITKKDGTAFEFAENGVNGGQVDLSVTNIEVDFPIDGMFMDGYGSSSDLGCSMVDEKTILVYVNYSADDVSIKGNKINVDLNTLTFWRVDERLGEFMEGDYRTETVGLIESVEVLEECQPVNGSTDSDEYHDAINQRIMELYDEYGLSESISVPREDEGDDTSVNYEKKIEVRKEGGVDCFCLVTSKKENEAYQKEFDEKVNELLDQYELKDYQKIDLAYNAEVGKTEFCIITSVKYDLTIESEMYLNYEEHTNEYIIDSENAKAIIMSENAEIKKANLVVSPFSIQFKCDFNDKSYNSDVASSHGKVDGPVGVLRMDTGKEYPLYIDGEESSFNPNTGEADIVTNLITVTGEEDDMKMAVIDINNLKEIEMYGVVIPL